jgi:hypothetical protein
MHNRLKITVSLLLAFLFAAYYGSTTLFNHTHFINGVAISHSHPFNPFSEKLPTGHEHTSEEFKLIQFLSNVLISSLILAISFKIILPLIEFMPGINSISSGFVHEPAIFFLRAPPA